MRNSAIYAVIVLVAGFALAWGYAVGRNPAPPRPADQTTPATAAWYAGLPRDPVLATQAYLDRIPAAMREQGERYSDTRMLAFQLRVLTLLLATAFLLGTRFAAMARDAARSLFSREPLVDATVAVQYFIALFLLSLPAEVYANFVRAHRFGFSDQPFGGWLLDTVVNWGVLTLFYLVATLTIYQFMRRRPTQWAAWAIGVYLVLRMSYALLSPNVLEPLTSDYRPLAEGPQKQAILALARANGLKDVAVVSSDASRQTRLLNAHVSGIGDFARIVVDDNTLRQTSDPMLRAVVGHEIGHYVMNHDPLSALFDTLIMTVGFAILAVAMRLLVRTAGPRWGITGLGDSASLPLFWGLFALWGFVSLPVSNAVWRTMEHQADLYGLNASQAPLGLAEFMIHDADSVRLRPTSLEYALFYSHPSDAERIATAMQWRAASLGQTAPVP